MRGLQLLLAAGLCLLAPAAIAQTNPLAPETFEIGLSTETISVGTNFGGARLVVFGALDNADQRLLRQGRYDIVVILEGPRRDIVVREKKRFFGLWINRGAERFNGVQSSYSLVSTRALRDIAPTTTLRQLDIGSENLEFEAPNAKGVKSERGREFAEAVRRLNAQRGLFTETVGDIDFVSATLFRANLTLPADLPVGRHVARAILFRDGVFVRERSEDLWVVKTGIESQISRFASTDGGLYGLLAVGVAIFTGWFGRIIFKRD
ncbi:TIGR02186 family protein [Aureimonas sp. ME7]|uniref:TIGR02186 family protein n=1 Tax=Aureimonas sp. ME7 TaxID=2744252 RepID=UPI0015F401F4|nr:TIGR02186 family protein [Aureimonas sp. ME7]